MFLFYFITVTKRKKTKRPKNDRKMDNDERKYKHNANDL